MKLVKNYSLVLLLLVVVNPVLKGMNTMASLPEQETLKIEFIADDLKVDGINDRLEIPLDVAKISGLFSEMLPGDTEFEDDELDADSIPLQCQKEDFEALLEAMEYIAQQWQERWPRAKTTVLLYERLSKQSYPAIAVRMQAIESALRLMDCVNYLDIPELYDALLYRFIGLHQNKPEVAEEIAAHGNVDLAKRIYGLLGTVPEYPNEDNSPVSEFYRDISSHLPSNLYTTEGQRFVETFCSIDLKIVESFVESLKANNRLEPYLGAILRYYMNNPAAAALELPYGATLWVVSKRLQAFDREKKRLNLSIMFSGDQALERQEFNEIWRLLLPFLEPLLRSEIYNLDLHTNELSGPIPPELRQLTALVELNLSLNKLSGSIPEALGQLRKLQQLNLDNNQLSGPIHPALGQLTALEYLDLHTNELSGPIPPALGQLTALKKLNLSWNQLSGPIPPELELLRQQTGLQISLQQGFVLLEG